MKTLYNLLNIIYQLFHFHNWYYGHYSLGARSKFTGDLIGRSERRCVDCECKEISISSLSVETKHKIIEVLGKRKYYPYKDGDWLDKFTRYKLLADVVDYTEDNNKIETIIVIIDN
jgi:hypothetical protein